jgi:hypothetical protein
MHKSGTTLVSQILHCSGINMGEDIDPRVSYDRRNKYERCSTLALNLELLGLGDIGASSLNVEAPDTSWLTGDQRARMRDTLQACDEAYADWGFKDPRTCLAYPLWAAELPEHKIIAIYRPPGEIWPRYRVQHLHHYYRSPSRAWTFVNGWCRYNSSILTHLQRTSMDFLVLSYRELVTHDAELSRLQEFVGIRLSDQRDPSLYRGRSETSLLIKIMAWLVRTQTGVGPDEIIQQFEAYRNDNL